MKSRTTVVLSAMLVTLLAGCGSSPESAVESFYKAVAKGELTEAKTYFSKEAISMLPPQKITYTLTKQSEGFTRCGGLKAVKSELKGEGEIRSGTATVEFVDAQKCKPEAINIRMVKEDGVWKLAAQ